jgi:acetyltransferase-like isoleucine patch superfamily enzyme
MTPRLPLETLLRHHRRWLTRWRAWRWWCRGVALPAPAEIGAQVELRWRDDPERTGSLSFGPGVHLGRGVLVHTYGGAVVIGSRVHLGPYTTLYAHGGLTLGDDCLVGPHCCLVAGEHRVPPLGTAIRSQPDRPAPIRIGRDVWLGAHVTVLGDVEIGEGCIVGAGAVVTRSLPAGAIAAGVPARVIGQRPSAPP